MKKDSLQKKHCTKMRESEGRTKSKLDLQQLGVRLHVLMTTRCITSMVAVPSIIADSPHFECHTYTCSVSKQATGY